MMRPARPLLWLAALAWLGACSSQQPAPAERERQPEPVLRTEAQERKVGAEAAEGIAAQMGLLDDPALNAYVNRVGQRLARNAPHSGFQYSFQIVDQDAPNAFALPGGFIYVSRGLLVLSNSEEELAGVLGHEIVHVAQHHAAARQAMMRSLPAIFRFSAMGQLAAYGRNQEREADRIGQGLAAVSGYDPKGLASFLRQLEYSERLQWGFSRLPGFLDTHPATSERVASAGARAHAIRWMPQAGIARDRNDYLRRLDGLLVGTGGSEGVVRRDRFLHPDLGFSMRFPNGWDVVNTRQAVGAISPRRDAQVVLEFQGSGSDPQQAASEFLEEARGQGLRVDRQQPVRIGDLQAFRAEGRAPGVSVHLTWIAREGAIYRLTGAAMGVTNTRAGIFHNVARSFRPITPRERASVRETRVRIVPARAGESIAELSQRTRNAWNIQETAVANGVFADARFEAGQRVKVAISQPYQGGR